MVHIMCRWCDNTLTRVTKCATQEARLFRAKTCGRVNAFVSERGTWPCCCFSRLDPGNNSLEEWCVVIGCARENHQRELYDPTKHISSRYHHWPHCKGDRNHSRTPRSTCQDIISLRVTHRPFTHTRATSAIGTQKRQIERGAARRKAILILPTHVTIEPEVHSRDATKSNTSKHLPSSSLQKNCWAFSQ
ncbi:unnamed protein product [Ectocarpus sp. 8 AP-2014]